METPPETMSSERPSNMGTQRINVAGGDHLDILVSREANGRNLISTPPCHAVMKYMIPSLLALVALKYQGRPESLFVENSILLWCFLIATCFYWVIVGGMKQMPTLYNIIIFQIFKDVAFASGVLSAASLISILLPHELLLVPFIIWIPLPVVLAWPILYGTYTWLRTRITALFNVARAKLVSGETSLPP